MGKRIANIQKKATNLSTEELVGTQAQRLGKTLPDPNSNKIGATASTNVQTPTDVPLQKKSAADMQKIDQANRRNYVLDGDYETAMKKGDISPAEYVQAMQHKAQTEGRELDAYETALKIMKGDDTLTPEQQAKKERRERLGQVLSNVGNLIGNVANVYYASKGGLPIALNQSQMANNERYLQAIERRKALEQKGKETLLAAKQQDIKAARERAAEERKMAYDKYKFDNQMDWDKERFGQQMDYNKEKDAADNAYRNKQLEHQADVLAENARSNKANEALRWAQFNKPQDSAVGSDGYVYTLNRPLKIKDKKSIIDSLPRESVHRLSYIDERGIQTTFGEAYPQYLTDAEWEEVYNQAESMGLITPDILVSRGFLRGKQAMNNPAKAVQPNRRQSYAGGYIDRRSQQPQASKNSKDLSNLF